MPVGVRVSVTKERTDVTISLSDSGSGLLVPTISDKANSGFLVSLLSAKIPITTTTVDQEKERKIDLYEHAQISTTLKGKFITGHIDRSNRR